MLLILGDFLTLPERLQVPSDILFFVDVVDAIEAEVEGRDETYGG
jgi:hypothetical protein